jgi:cell division inhibitor SepF
VGVMNKLMNFFGLHEDEEIVEQERLADSGEESETNPFEQRKNKGNVVSIHSQRNVRVVLTEPRTYDETQEIADQLRARRPVIVNLQSIRPDLAMRIVDFLSGTVYALNGGISKIGPNIFLCTPDSVEIHGAIKETADEDTNFN